MLKKWFHSKYIIISIYTASSLLSKTARTEKMFKLRGNIDSIIAGILRTVKKLKNKKV